MLTTIKGTYSNGQVTLLEPPPTEEAVEVLVTFTEKASLNANPIEPAKRRIAGFSKGTILYMAPDFDAPLDELNEYM